MSRAEIVFAIRIEFKGAQVKLNHSLKITTRCVNLIRQIADTIVAKGTIFVDLIPRTFPRCMCKWFNVDVLAVPIKAFFGQICVTGHQYKTRTMSANSRSTNLLDKDYNIWWQLAPFLMPVFISTVAIRIWNIVWLWQSRYTKWQIIFTVARVRLYHPILICSDTFVSNYSWMRFTHIQSFTDSSLLLRYCTRLCNRYKLHTNYNSVLYT